MEDKILFDPNWEKLNAHAKELQAEGKLDFVGAIQEVVKARPDLIVNQELLDRALELISKNEDLSIMDAIKLIQEEERVSLGEHSKEGDVEVYSKESVDLNRLAKEKAKTEGISYSDALREVSSEYPALVGKVEKYGQENVELDKRVKIYMEQNPSSGMNYTQTLLHLLNLEDSGISFGPKE